jgi:type IV pilus assembly protein PilV
MSAVPVRCRCYSGLTMIEVLVALSVVAFGLLGLLGVQARALSFQKDAFDRRSAADMASQLGERMRANHIGLIAGAYRASPNPLQDTGPTPVAIPGCTVPTACTPEEIAARDLAQWHGELRRRMPGTAAHVEWDAGSPLAARVTIGWPEPRSSGPDSVCDGLGERVGASLPATYRCFETSMFP